MLKGEQSTLVPAVMAAHLRSPPPHPAQPSQAAGKGPPVTRSPASPPHLVSSSSAARLTDVALEAGGDGGLPTPAVQAGPAVAGQAHGRARNVTGQGAGVHQPVAVHRSMLSTVSTRPPDRTRPLMKVRPHLIDHQTHHTRMHACMHAWVRVHTHTHTHARTRTNTHTRTHIHPRTPARTHTRVCVRVHTHTYTQTHTDTP